MDLLLINPAFTFDNSTVLKTYGCSVDISEMSQIWMMIQTVS
jgi:hypothetical protein